VTGLNTGTVGVHQLSISAHHLDSNNNDGDENEEENSSRSILNPLPQQPQHSYSISTAAPVRWFSPKHARPATSVSFRPNDSARHFVVGLDGFRRDFSCLVWDVEHNAASSNNTGVSNAVWKSLAEAVSSLNWVDEQTLAIGCMKFLRLFDVRVSGTSNPPLSALAHNSKVLGTLPKNNIVATFTDKAGEPVKLWDIRKFSDPIMTVQNETGEVVECVSWSKFHENTIACCTGSAVRTFNVSSHSRPTQVNTVYNPTPIGYISFQPPNSADCDLFPEKMIVTGTDGSVNEQSNSTVTNSVAISPRDMSIGGTVGCKSYVIGRPSISDDNKNEEDIFDRIRRRAVNNLYGMDSAKNLQMLSDEKDEKINTNDNSDLFDVWSWVGSIEYKPRGNLIEEGAATLLGLKFTNSNDENNDENDEAGDPNNRSNVSTESVLTSADVEDINSTSFSEELKISYFSSKRRDPALVSCGYLDSRTNKLKTVMSDAEAIGNYDRSAALAIFNGDLTAGVDALERGSSDSDIDTKTSDTFSLVATLVAGFAVTPVWLKACEKVLSRRGIPTYLKIICVFLSCINKSKSNGDDNRDEGEGNNDSSDSSRLQLFKEILNNNKISLSDRIGFSIKFLPYEDLQRFFLQSFQTSLQNSKLEGLLITGLSKDGVQLIQSYVDRTADIQTAAFVSCRVVFTGADCVYEKQLCSEFLENYRDLLNAWGFWEQRAKFDCARADLLRERNRFVKSKSSAGAGASKGGSSNENDDERFINVPVQLQARCNFCNMCLPLSYLRRQEGMSNSFLTRQKAILSCCPACRKPLPRCYVCLLGLGCLNPYTELKRQRQAEIKRDNNRNRGGGNNGTLGGFSSLGNDLGFSNFWTWCTVCKHGGHTNHLLQWFQSHDTCGVSGCDCKCQFGN